MAVGNQVHIGAAAPAGSTARDQQLTRLIHHLPGMAYRYACDGDGWCLEFVSDGCMALTGRSPKDLLADCGQPYVQMVHPEDRQVVIERANDVSPAQGKYNCVYRLILPENEVRWVRDQGAGVFSDTGDLLFCEGFVLDISDEKQQEGVLIRSEEEVERLIQSIQDGVFLIQNDVLKFVNRTLADMLGYTVIVEY